MDSVDSWESKLDCWTQTAKVLDHMTEAAANKFTGNYFLIYCSDGIWGEDSHMKRLGSNMPIISLRGISRICLTFGVQNEMPLFLAAKVPFLS